MVPLAKAASFRPFRARTCLNRPDSARSLRRTSTTYELPGRSTPLASTIRMSAPVATALKSPALEDPTAASSWPVERAVFILPAEAKRSVSRRIPCRAKKPFSMAT